MAVRRKTRQQFISLGEPLEAAIREKIEGTNITIAGFIRGVLANHFGRPDLADTVVQGRPKKTAANDEPAATAPRKRAVKKTGQVVSAPRKVASRKQKGVK